MFNSLSLFIAARYSRSKQANSFISFITFFSVAGITLGVLALITVVSVMNGFESELKKRILGVIPHIVVTHIVVTHDVDNEDNSFQLQQSLLQSPYVLGVSPFIQTKAMIQSPVDMQAVMIQGIDPIQSQNYSVIANNMRSGMYDSLQAKSYNVVIGRQLAAKLGVNIGDKIRLMLAEKTVYTPMGRMPIQRKFTVSAIFNVGSDVDDHVALIHHDDLAKMLRKSTTRQDSLRIYLNDAFDYQIVTEHINTHFSQWQITDWRQSQGKLFSAVSMEKNMMWLMLCLIIAVAAFNIVSALVMVVNEKQGEIAMLKTMGIKPSEIQLIFIFQGLYKGCLGAILGTLSGVLVTYFLNDILSLFGSGALSTPGYNAGLPTDIRFEQIALIVISAITMSLLATLYPSYKAAHTKPVEILRYE